MQYVVAFSSKSLRSLSLMYRLKGADKKQMRLILKKKKILPNLLQMKLTYRHLGLVEDGKSPPATIYNRDLS